MADENAGNSGFTGPVGPPPSDEGRMRAHADEQGRDVVFVERKMNPEKLESLKAFLKTASADDIAIVRKMYGENIEVLKLIGIEVEKG